MSVSACWDALVQANDYADLHTIIQEQHLAGEADASLQ